MASITAAATERVSPETAIVLRQEGLLATFPDSSRPAALWLGRLCECSQMQAEVERSVAAALLDTRVLGVVARVFLKDPRVGLAGAVAKEMEGWSAKVESFIEGARTLDRAHRFALRLLVGRSLISLSNLSASPNMASHALALTRTAQGLKESFGITSTYETLVAWFIPFQGLLEVKDPIEYLLDASSDGIGLVHYSEVNARRSNLEVSRKLAELYTLLSGTEGPRALEEMQPVELLALYCLFNRLVLNYVTHQSLKMDLHYQIVSCCSGVREILQRKLDAYHSDDRAGYESFWARFQASFSGLEEVWGQARSVGGFPADFLTNPVHAEVLAQLVGDNLEVYRQVVNKGSVSIPGLDFIHGDDEAGFRVYRLPARSGACERLILAVQTRGLEHWASHYDPRQCKVSSRFTVNGHQQVLVAAASTYQSFLRAMEEEKAKEGQEGIDRLPLTAVGFGLDGAVAQLMAHQWRREHPLDISHPKEGHLFVGFGVPRYLELDSAADVGSRGFAPSEMPHCLYSLNFVNFEDTRIYESVLSRFAAPGTYSDTNCNVFPLVDKVAMALDLTRHAREDYTFNVEAAVTLPVMFYRQFQQLHSTLERSRRRRELLPGLATPTPRASALAALAVADTPSASSND